MRPPKLPFGWEGDTFRDGISVYGYIGYADISALFKISVIGIGKVRTNKISAIGYRLCSNISSKYRLYVGDFPPIYR